MGKGGANRRSSRPDSQIPSPTSMIMQGEHTDGKQPRIERDDFPELRRAL